MDKKYTKYSNVIEYTTVTNDNITRKITYTTKAHKPGGKKPSGTYETKENSKSPQIRPLTTQELKGIFLDDSASIKLANEPVDYMLIDN